MIIVYQGYKSKVLVNKCYKLTGYSRPEGGSQFRSAVDLPVGVRCRV